MKSACLSLFLLFQFVREENWRRNEFGFRLWEDFSSATRFINRWPTRRIWTSTEWSNSCSNCENIRVPRKSIWKKTTFDWSFKKFEKSSWTNRFFSNSVRRDFFVSSSWLFSSRFWRSTAEDLRRYARTIRRSPSSVRRQRLSAGRELSFSRWEKTDFSLFDRTTFVRPGDYVDRGKMSIETIVMLFCYKIKFAENFFLLRGNHECASINRIYGFYDEVKRRYNVKLWKTFTDCFNCLPIAAIIDEKIFCCHGGLSPDLHSFEQIRRIARPTDVPDTGEKTRRRTNEGETLRSLSAGLLCDLLWSDPDKDTSEWGENDRGVSFTFGPEVVTRFLTRHDLDLICRGHQVVEDGYEFFAKRQLVTIFSAPNYCGEFDNAGGVMSVDENLMCSFQILRPSTQKPMQESQTKATKAHPAAVKTPSATKTTNVKK